MITIRNNIEESNESELVSFGEYLGIPVRGYEA